MIFYYCAVTTLRHKREMRETIMGAISLKNNDGGKTDKNKHFQQSVRTMMYQIKIIPLSNHLIWK
jgi:hypothetical protein